MLIDDEPMTATNALPESPSPGRSCPLHYRYAPEVFQAEAPPRLQSLDVLYVVGGLYGNELALERVLELFDRERGRKRLVFNGDFHWFDVDPEVFARVQAAVLAHDALRGNVETELTSDDGDEDAGCGCAYPDWVGDGVVERSNQPHPGPPADSGHAPAADRACGVAHVAEGRHRTAEPGHRPWRRHLAYRMGLCTGALAGPRTP
jgi:hypothetical protein